MPANEARAPVLTRTALIIAPFWGDPTHVGCHRVERMIRWLRSVDVEIAVVKAGPRALHEPRDWGVELAVADPLHAVSMPQQRTRGSSSHLVQLRRIAVNAVSPPDGRMPWARRVASDPEVRTLARRATWIISSSPPESSHLAALELAREANAKLVVDMRDGWLDEPLKWLLQHSRVQRWREGKMERRVLAAADRVFVVSDVLRDMLVARVPATRPKVAVLTNCGPPATTSLEPRAPDGRQRPLSLLYAGRFTGSNRRQDARVLFDVLERAARANEAPSTEVRLLGDLERADLAAIERARAALAPLGWRVSSAPAIPRVEALAAMADADGLLLLALGRGVLTTKLFEYLATGRPILAVTVEGGAIWRLRERVPQLFTVAIEAPRHEQAAVRAFFDACAAGRRYPAPSEFSEDSLRTRFLEHLGALRASTDAV